MATELEIKLRIGDPVALRERLRASGAEMRGRVFETNTFLDTAEHALFERGSGLRVRVTRPLDEKTEKEKALLTFKGPLAASPMRMREELEIDVSSAETLRTLLARLGFGAVLEFEKRRETWALGSCRVELDELPRLGWFVEVEGPELRAIAEVCARLQFAQTDALPMTYAEMTAKHGIEVDGLKRLRFET